MLYPLLIKLHQHLLNFLHHQPRHYYTITRLAQAYFRQKVTSYLHLYF